MFFWQFTFFFKSNVSFSTLLTPRLFIVLHIGRGIYKEQKSN